ncbi:unnamed protein product [Prorocentrum cordatum]|uniref:Band 7 domain-containing protein n=1 Tax=Prorocentrum cordatum TaxID=2364126 RepID=A0ABN9W565_9DINO|nr:unnamed protein product [Polarella glacialis]
MSPPIRVWPMDNWDVERAASVVRETVQKPRYCIPIACIFMPCFIMSICALASIHNLDPQQQLLVKDPSGYWVRNGPWSGCVITHREKVVRSGTLLEPKQYAVVKNVRTGRSHNVVGPQFLFLGPYDTLVGVKSTFVLLKGQYVRLVDQARGTQRVLVGPQAVVPEPTEVASAGVQQAHFLDADTALLIRDKQTGMQTLVAEAGMYTPTVDEEVIEERHLIHVLSYEALVIRDARGQLILHSGAEGDGTGSAFFLPPYHEVVEMHWSNFSKPPDQQTMSKDLVTRVDMRSRRMRFAYEVRTSDSVTLVLEGTIFWQIKNLSMTLAATADPEGDVWHHARSSLIQSASKVTLQAFMAGFNVTVAEAFGTQAADSFYSERGVELQSMEVTKFDCADSETAVILQSIIQESTNKINKLTVQASENEVAAAALNAEIQLAKQKTELIETEAANLRIQSMKQGEAEGLQLAGDANAFIAGLDQTIPDVNTRVDLYTLRHQLRSRNTDTQNLASGTAHLFVAPEDLSLKLNVGSDQAGHATDES